MNPDMMALLKSILSGQGMGGSPQPMASPMQVPMAAQPQTQTPQMPMPAQQQPAQMPARNVLPMGGNPPRNAFGGHDGVDLGDTGGVTPGVNPGVDDGKGHDGKGGGDHGKGSNLSKFEELMRKIANRGPRAYTKQIDKNLGVKEITPGYGKADPSTMKTGMANSLANVLTGTQPKTY